MAAGTTGGAKALERGARVANKLELVRPLATGGMGAVWVARNLATGAEVAVKVLRPDGRRDADVEARFRHEARLGATLGHRNITRVFDLLEDSDGSLFLVMELLRGDTLKAHLQTKKTLSNKEAVAIVVPLLSALQHAHERGVVHRDLKPSNVFLHVDPDGQVTPKLIDFGIAKADGSAVQTRTGDALGTPGYMSPEQVRAIDLDGRSDLFAIGAVLYELITGGPPFAGPTSTAILAQVLEVEVDPDPKIEPRLWLEIQRALGKQAYERHATAKDLAAALCAAIGETETSLAQLLQRDPTEVAALFPDPATPEPAAPSAGSLGGASLSVPRRTRARRALAVAGALSVVIAAVVLAIGITARLGVATGSNDVTTRPAATVTTATAATSTATADLAPTSAPVIAEPVASSEQTSPPPAASAPEQPPPRRVSKDAPSRRATKPSAPTPGPASSKSLARTPGF